MESVFKNGGDWEGGGERNRKCFVYSTPSSILVVVTLIKLRNTINTSKFIKIILIFSDIYYLSLSLLSI